MVQFDNWAPSYLGDVFDEVQRGRRIVSANHEDGNIALVSSMGSNNGVTGFVGNTEGVRIFANCLTIANGGASAGKCYYQPFEFVASDHVTHCKRGGLDMDGYHILAACMTSAMVGKFSFSHELKDNRLPREQVMLPSTGDGEPDWECMSSYSSAIRSMLINRYRDYLAARISELEYEDLPSLNEVEWRPISVSSMFELIRGREGNMSSMVSGDTPLISAKRTDNGLKAFVCTSRKVAGRCITLNNDGDGGAGLAFYQPSDMALDTHVTALVPIEKMSMWTMLFVARCLSNLHGFFGHGLSISNDRAAKIKVMLPVNDAGGPDCAYMEQYTKNLMLRKYQQYLRYLDAGLASGIE